MYRASSRSIRAVDRASAWIPWPKAGTDRVFCSARPGPGGPRTFVGKLTVELARRGVPVTYRRLHGARSALLVSASWGDWFHALCRRWGMRTALRIVSEAIVDGRNGFILEGSVGAFAARLEWCKAHLSKVRAMRLAHREVIPEKHRVQDVSELFADLMMGLLSYKAERRAFVTRWQHVTGLCRGWLDTPSADFSGQVRKCRDRVV